jgi:hypothetical protein
MRRRLKAGAAEIPVIRPGAVSSNKRDKAEAAADHRKDRWCPRADNARPWAGKVETQSRPSARRRAFRWWLCRSEDVNDPTIQRSNVPTIQRSKGRHSNKGSKTANSLFAPLLRTASLGTLDRWIVGSLERWIVGSLDFWSYRAAREGPGGVSPAPSALIAVIASAIIEPTSATLAGSTSVLLFFASSPN